MIIFMAPSRLMVYISMGWGWGWGGCCTSGSVRLNPCTILRKFWKNHLEMRIFFLFSPYLRQKSKIPFFVHPEQGFWKCGTTPPTPTPLIDKEGADPLYNPEKHPFEMGLVTMHEGCLKFRMNPKLSHPDQYSDVTTLITSSESAK